MLLYITGASFANDCRTMTACYMWTFVEESEKGCVFGRGLEEHLKATGRDVAFVLEECIGFLLAHLDEEVRHLYTCRFTYTCPVCSYLTLISQLSYCRDCSAWQEALVR